VENFEAMITKERERLNRSRGDLLAKKAEIDKEISSIDTELKAITAYEQAKSGRAPSASRSGGTGTRRSGIREEVLSAVKDASPDGASRSDLLAKLGAKGEKSAEQSVSNALSALKKAGTISQKGNLYIAA
jgi:hypothetical protein